MDFSHIRIDISNRAPLVTPDDPYACPACGGVGTVPVWRRGILGPNPTSGERVCDRCKGLGLDPEPPSETSDDVV